MKKQTMEHKRLMGERQADSDGFTYYYGKYNTYPCTRSANIKRQIRNDKRSVKASEDTRILKELKDEEEDA